MENNNCCRCGTPEFTLVMNQQGPQGIQGTPGLNGFSPQITAVIDTSDTYVLRITTSEGYFDTPNLRTTISSNVGFEGQVLFKTATSSEWRFLPEATQETLGIISIAKDEDVIFNPEDTDDEDDPDYYSDDVAITPRTLKIALDNHGGGGGSGGLDPNAIKGSDSITVERDANSVTLSVDSKGVDYELLKYLPMINGVTLIGDVTLEELGLSDLSGFVKRLVALETAIDGGNANSPDTPASTDLIYKLINPLFENGHIGQEEIDVT